MTNGRPGQVMIFHPCWQLVKYSIEMMGQSVGNSPTGNGGQFYKNNVNFQLFNCLHFKLRYLYAIGCNFLELYQIFPFFFFLTTFNNGLLPYLKKKELTNVILKRIPSLYIYIYRGTEPRRLKRFVSSPLEVEG